MKMGQNEQKRWEDRVQIIYNQAHTMCSGSLETIYAVTYYIIGAGLHGHTVPSLMYCVENGKRKYRTVCPKTVVTHFT